MGTEKRQRHKAAHRARIDQAWKEYEAARRRRRLITLAVVVVAAVVGVGLFTQLRDDDDGTAAETTEPAAPAECPPASGADERKTTFATQFPLCIDGAKGYRALVTTSEGEFTIELDPVSAPLTVNNFVTLARFRYFDGIAVCRIVADFVIQSGNPDVTDIDQGGCASGGPGYNVPDELPGTDGYSVGEVVMANNSAPNTSGSQFFIVTGDGAATLPGTYSLFGKVTDGLDVVLAIGELAGADEQPTKLVTIESVEITETDLPVRVRDVPTDTIPNDTIPGDSGAPDGTILDNSAATDGTSGG